MVGDPPLTARVRGRFGAEADRPRTIRPFRLSGVDALLASVAAAGISGVVAFAIYTFHVLRADVADLREEMRRGFAELRADLGRIERSRR